MALTVYGASLSPFVRKLRVALIEKGLSYEHVSIDPFKKPDYYQDISPFGRIPALKDGDNIFVDSGVICNYLDAKYNDTALRPTDPLALARTLWFEKFGDYELAPLLTFVVFRNRVLASLRGMECDESAVQHALTDKIPPLLNYLEGQLTGCEFIVGDTLTIADIAIAAQFANFAYGGEKVDAQRWPKIARYVDGILNRPSFKPLVEEENTLIAKIKNR